MFILNQSYDVVAVCHYMLKNVLTLFQFVEKAAYKVELKSYEDRKRADLDKARLKAQEAVSQYKVY